MEGYKTDLGEVLLRRSAARAIDALERAVDQGNERAAFSLAQAYELRGGLEAQAMRMYRRAASFGDGAAAYNLACECRKRRNWRGERRWLERAVSLGDVDALLALLEMDLHRRSRELSDSAKRQLSRYRRSRNQDIAADAREILSRFRLGLPRRYLPAKPDQMA